MYFTSPDYLTHVGYQERRRTMGKLQRNDRGMFLSCALNKLSNEIVLDCLESHAIQNIFYCHIRTRSVINDSV
jgi:hypothetical protein